jgi:hypothetical protein
LRRGRRSILAKIIFDFSTGSIFLSKRQISSIWFFSRIDFIFSLGGRSEIAKIFFIFLYYFIKSLLFFELPFSSLKFWWAARSAVHWSVEKLLFYFIKNCKEYFLVSFPPEADGRRGYPCGSLTKIPPIPLLLPAH